MHCPDCPATFPRALGPRHRPVALLLALAGLLVLATGGCTSTGVSLRSVPKNPLADTLQLASYSGPKPSERTMQVLRVCNLEPELKGDATVLLAKLQAIIEHDPSAEKVYAFAELAYLGAKRAERHNPLTATDLYGASVLYAHQYLFGERYSRWRNPYDPQFRRACDLYNGALEGALRIATKAEGLQPGTTKTIRTAAGCWDITCVLRGSRWRAEDFDHFEFVSDYEIKGLRNHYRSHGLGVPLIAVRRSYSGDPSGGRAQRALPNRQAAAKYYPVDLSFPVTAFFRPIPNTKPCTGHSGEHRQGLLELYDPLTTTDTWVGDRLVPLESDLTTPLAYFLSKPELGGLATVGLLRPGALLEMRPDRPNHERVRPIMGLYMAQPYEPGKIPVLLVHGLWSSPMTWMEMFNDLRSSPEIRDHYQFWFYLYPTGQPFWLSAIQLRRDLTEVRHVLDPNRREPALDQMVLIGHSMGGLVAKLQTIDSKDHYWNLASHEPFGQVRAEPSVRERLRYAFFFQPNPSIRRVITIGTPHHGSRFSNQTTRWLLAKLISLPQKLVASQQKLFQENRGLFHSRSLLRVQNGIDSLAPDSPIFPVMLANRRPPWVKYHNIIGLVPDGGWLASLVAGSDGVVSQESAHLDDAESELTVPATHTAVHSHPAAVLEVRRILYDHLDELRGRPIRGTPEIPNVVPAARRVKVD